MANEVPECCGSGCTNCVLDEKPSKHTVPFGLANVFDRTYKPFVCTLISKETESVFRFRFQHCPASIHKSGEFVIVPPGCHLMLRAKKLAIHPLNHNEDNLLRAWRALHFEKHFRRNGMKEIQKYDQSEDDLYFSRPYTPIASDRETGTFDVLIKLEPGGAMTDYLLSLSIGSSTEWKGLYGDFVWKRNQHRNVVAFVQGVAIAPVYSVLRAILDDQEDDTRLTMCACFRDLQNVLLRDELRSMASYWNFRYEVYLSRRMDHCPPVPVRYAEPIHDRRLVADDIERLLERSLSHGNQSGLLVLLCGTEPFTAFIKSSLVKLEIENCYTF